MKFQIVAHAAVPFQPVVPAAARRNRAESCRSIAGVVKSDAVSLERAGLQHAHSPSQARALSNKIAHSARSFGLLHLVLVVSSARKLLVSQELGIATEQRAILVLLRLLDSVAVILPIVVALARVATLRHANAHKTTHAHARDEGESAQAIAN
jgi:hypothetical protein